MILDLRPTTCELFGNRFQLRSDSSGIVVVVIFDSFDHSFDFLNWRIENVLVVFPVAFSVQSDSLEMTKYRDRSWFFRVLSWKRLLLITCFAVAVVMIVRTPMNGPPKNEPSVIIDRLAVRDWDGDTVNLFKKQLGILNKSGKPTFSCKDLWEENNNYLIVTGFPSEDEDDLESHLWLYLNLLSLEKFDSVQSPTLRLLLPSRTKAVLRKIFQNIQFGDLSNLLHCAEDVQLDRMLAKSRIVGHFEEISFNEQRTTENIQLVILNRDTKRVNELSRFDFSFLPYRPLFTQELMQKVRPLIAGLVNTGERAGDDNTNPADVGTVSHNLIGVYIDERDNVSKDNSSIVISIITI